MLHHADPLANRRRPARPRLTPLARGLLAACLLSPALAVPPALAAGPTLPNGLPNGLQVVHGQATVSTQGAQMTVRNSPSAILDWQSFSIAAGNRVYFDQASTSSKVLNRVVGNDPTQIFGSLASNGQVWLLNPNGVLFGQGARVDVASLVTSTLRLGDSDFLAGRYRFSADGASAATVRNEGALHSSFGGQVVLLGGRVENAGDISAPGGQVALAAANSVDLVDTGLPNLTVRVDVPAGEVLNLGRLAAAGGRVDVYGAIVNQQGLASAETLSLGAQGQIILRASETLTLGSDSRTEATGGTGAQGGGITLLGHDIALLGQAVVDASGAASGGRIRLGGGLQGKDSSVPNASTVQVAAGSLLSADALARGNGGQVIVWSDDSTQFLGRISARGGASGGDGGFAEVSSRQLLGYGGAADLRASAGATGSLLLDPNFLVIQATSPDIAGNSSGLDLSAPNLLFSNFAGATSTITAGAVNAQLASSNVVLQASTDITVNAAVSGTNGLTLQAGRNIAVNSSISAGGGITLSANDPGGTATGTGAVQLAAAANLDAGAGSLTITNNGGSGVHAIGGNLSAASLNITGNLQLTQASTWQLSGSSTVPGVISGSGALTKSGTGTLTLSGANTYTGGTTVATGTLATSGSERLADAGALTVNGGGAFTLGGDETIGTLAGAGNVSLGTGTLTTNTNTDSTFSGVIGGSGNLTKVGNGWLTLTGNNTFTGTTTVFTDQGHLIIGGSGSTLVGPMVINGGRVVFNNTSPLTLPSLTMIGGWLSGTGDLVVSGSFTVPSSSAEINGSGSFTTQGATSVNLANVVGGFLGISKPWVNAGALTLSGDDYLYVGYSQGSGGSLTNTGAGVITLNTTAATPMAIYTGTNTFTNGGTLIQSAAGTHTLSLNSISNSGTVNIVAGDLAISASGADTGTYAVASGSTLVFSGGTRTLDTGSNITGAGTLLVNGATVTTNAALDLAHTGTAITVSSGTLNLGGSVGGTLVPVSVSGGTLNFNNASAVTLPSLSLSGGTLAGSGDITVSGNFDVTGTYATLAGSGAFTTQGTSTVNLANVNGGYLGLNRNWVNNGTLTVGGDDYIYLGLPSGGSTTLTNAVGATLNLSSSNSQTLANYTGTTTINNAGTLNQTASGSHTLNPGNFNNTGTVNLGAGTLAVNANGTDTGTYTVPSGSTLNFPGGTRTLDTGSNITGGGTLLVSGATVTSNGTLDLAHTGTAITVSSGTLNLGGSVGGTLVPVSVSGGTLNFNNASAVTLPSLSLSGGTLAGSGDITVSGNFDVTGTYATLAGSGAFTTQGTSTVNLASVNGGYLGLNRNWVNNGTLTVGGDDYIYLGLPSGGSTTLTNAVGATLNLSTSNSQTLANYTGTTTVNNAGTLNQTASGSHTVSATNFNNAGTVNLGAGTLAVNANGTDTGTYTVPSGSTLNFPGGTRTLDTGSNITGAGTLLVNGATVTANAALDLAQTGTAITVSSGTLNLGGSVGGTLVPVSVSGGTLNFNNASAVTLPSLTLSGGTVAGSGDIVVSGNFDVTGYYANLAGSGAFTTQGTSTVNLASANGGYLGLNRNWVNHGTLTVGGDDYIYLGLPSGGSTTLTNAVGATLNLSTSNNQTLANYTGTTTVNNAGTLNQTASGSHTLNPANFNNTGTVNLNAGTLSVNANGTDTGSYVVPSGSTLDLSGGTRTLDLASSVSGAGTLRVSGAAVNANGALSLANTGAAIVVTGGNLNLGGAVAGTLAPVSVSNGTLNFNTTSAVTLPSLSLSGGTIGGSGDVTVSGNFDVTGSYANLAGSGSLTTQGTSTVNLASVNGGYLGLNRNWVNNGTLTVGGDDYIYLGLPNGGNTTLTNAAGATLNLSTSNTQALVNYTGTTTVNNAGTLNQTASGSHTLSAISFNNTGTVNLNAGTLSVNANGSDTGAYAVASGSTLDFSGGTRTLDVTSSVTGAGTLSVSGAAITANGTMSLANTGAAIVVSNGTLSLGTAVAGTLVPVSVSGGTLNFNNPNPVTVPSLSLSGGTVGGSGDVTVSGNFDVTGSYASLTGSGTLTTQGTSTVNLASVGSGYLGLSRNWVNNGTLTVGGDDFIYFGLPSGTPSTLTNAAGATLNLSSSYSTPLALYTGTQTIVSAGTLNQTATGTHTISVPFSNTGTVNVATGTLALASDGTDSGSYALAAGTTLNVSSGTRTLAAGAALSGSGALAVSGGTLNVNTAIDFSGTPVSVSNGTLNFNNASAATLPSLSLSGGTVGGSGDITVSGNFDVTGSYATLTGSGHFTTQGTSTVNLASVSGGYLALSRNWLNNGTLTIGGDDFVYFGLPSGGTDTLTNAAGATLNLSSTSTTPLVLYTGSQTIVNAGTLNQTAAGTHTVSVPFSNSGTVNVLAGGLALGGDGTDSGLYALSAGTTLGVTSGTRTLAAGAGISGTGTLAISGGALNVNTAVDFSNTPVSVSSGTLSFNAPGTATLSSLSLSGGAVSGTGDVTVNGNFDVLGSYASLTGSGTLTTLGTSTVNMPSTTTGWLGVNKSWVNGGTLTVGGDDLLYFGYPNGGGATLSNTAGGTINLSTSYSSPLITYTGTSTIANAGTFNLTSSGAHTVSVSNTNNTGAIHVLAGDWTVAGTLTQSGQISTASGTSFQVPGNLTNQAGGTLSGSGTFAVGTGNTLTNQGTISPGGAGSAGTLSVTGNLALAGGTLAIDLGGTGAGNSDLLAVSGNATLAGNLNATLVGGYTPVNADFVPILSVGGTASGAFTGTSLPGGFTAGYNLAANEATRLIYAGTGGTKVFTNAANDLNWATPANWSGALPGSADSALISAGYSVVHATGTDTIAALTVNSANALNVSGGSLTVSGATALGGTFTVSGSGAATLNGDLTGAGQVNVQAGSLTLNGASSMAGLNLTGGTLGGTGSVNVAGSFSRSGTAGIAPNFSSVSITQAAGNLSPGALSAGTVSLTAQDASAALTIDNTVAATGALTINAAGTVQLAGAAAALSAGADLNLGAHSVDLAGPVSGNHLVIAGTNGVQLRSGAVLTSSVASGDAIVIDAAGTGPFINTAGAGALTTAGGRWLVYSADPSADTVGGLAASFRQYDAPYGSATPAGSGNGLLYSLAPVLTIGLQGTVSKVYDTTATATLAAANYAVSGALAIDNVALNNPTAGLYTSGGTGNTPKDAGSGKTVQVSGLTATVTDAAAGYPVYGLQFNSTASGTVGSITQAPLALTGLSAVGKVYDGNVAAGLSGTAAIAPLGSDSVALTGSASASFADKNVGTAKPVTVSGFGLTGADAANYSLQAPGGLSADITARPVSVLGLAAPDKVYDGGTVASASASLGGAVAGDAVSLALTAQFADRNVGDAKPVGVQIQLAGADAGNYLLASTSASTQASITPATLTYVATPVVSVIGTLPVLSGTVAGFVGGDTQAGSTTGQLAWSTPATVSSPAGLYRIDGSGLAAPNYQFTQAPGNATALSLALPITTDIVASASSASNASNASIAQALAVVAVPLEMSSPTSGRVLDVMQSLAMGDAGNGNPTYDSINLSQMQRDEIQSLLAARANFKLKVFGGGISKLLIDPALADVRGCRTVVELSGGNCLLTAALKQDIDAERARAAAQAAAAKKPAGRRVMQAVLPSIQRKMALLIGVNSYSDKRIPQLKGAVPDAQAVRDVLENHLGYETTVVANPGRDAIVRAFNKLALEAGPDDSVVIYYAGHGVVVPSGKDELGYWVPGDADVDKPETWLANADIARLVALIGARQVLLISDSCYSGTLVGSERVEVDAKADAADLLKRKAAVVMSSGGDEPVADIGREGHSVFAWYLMQTLKQLSTWEVGASVYDSVRASVSKSLPQTPQYGASRNAGHQGNTDYLFEQREIEKAAAQP